MESCERIYGVATAMASLESFLRDLHHRAGPINIVGGSPLYCDMPNPFPISINGLRAGAYAAAINNGKRDQRRVSDWNYILVPNPQPNVVQPRGAVVPESSYPLPIEFPAVQPTTCFSLLLICYWLKLPVNLFGVCGWASKWHDGDWEMHYIKRVMNKFVTVHDPRPKW